MAYRSYSDAEVTEALIRLSVNRYDYDKTAEQIGISVKTLRRWDKDALKKTVPELLERAIERLLMVIPERWSGNEWAIALGILMDKWLLLHGEPTERTESLVRTFEALTDDERYAVVEEAKQIIANISTVRTGDGDNHKS